ncbi:MAG: SRPBCC family protein [Verrucomicrobiota bacterium]|nr:SRPBCC family protein [Verrucomicrobiota bacterium]
MEHIEKSIVVEAPLSMVYNQWTQFEEFPEFMDGVESVRQLDDKRLHWRAKIAGKIKEWDAEIFDQTPDQRIAWRSISGAMNTGQVRFESLGENQTRVYLKLNYDPEGAVENIGDALGLVSSKIEGDLQRFKQFIESRGAETGAWRGEIHGRHVQGDQSAEARSKRLLQEDTSAVGGSIRPKLRNSSGKSSQPM